MNQLALLEGENKKLFNSLYTNFQGYKNFIMSIPNLSEDEEKKLSTDLKNKNDLSAAQKLVLAHLKIVLGVAHEYRGYGMDEQELVQEGNIGLMRAVKNFNPIKNNRLYTYAIIWVRAEIQSFILKNYKLLKLSTSKNMKKLFFNFRSLQKKLIDDGVDKNEIPDIIAKKLNVEKDEVIEASAYLSNTEKTINQVSHDSNEYTFDIIDSNESSSPEITVINKDYADKISLVIKESINSLDKREKQIIEDRFFSDPKLTHKEIAKKLSISSERVRQIEKDIMKSLKQKLISFK